jgi:hypothetical protein
MAVSCGFLGAARVVSRDRLFAQAPLVAAAKDFLCVKNNDPRPATSVCRRDFCDM